jgi:hypothetical protein
MRKFKLIISKKYTFSLTEENYHEIIVDDILRKQVTEQLSSMKARGIWIEGKGDFEITRIATTNEIELFDLIEKANEREIDGDYLTTAERQELVNKFLEAYKDTSEVMEKFPADKDLDSQFTYIVDEF